jgi:hypothetical protein
VSVPFNLGNLFAGKNPFEGASEAFGPPSQDFGDRMSDMVIRSHRVKTTTSGFQQTGILPATGITITQRGRELTFTPKFDDQSSSLGGLTLSGVSFSAGSIVSGGTLEGSGAISGGSGLQSFGGTLTLEVGGVLQMGGGLQLVGTLQTP